MNNDIDIILEEDKEIIINIIDGIDGKDGKSLHPAGEWNNSISYNYLDLVTHSDGSFVAVTDVPAGTSLYNTAYWQIVAKSGAYRWGDISGDLSNQTDLANALNDKADASSIYTKTEVNNLLDGKQDELTFDTTPTANSDNPVKSSGIKTALDAKADASGVYTKSEMDDFIDDLQDQIDNINKFDIHICTSGEYDPTTYIPTVANPKENTFYLVPTGTGTDMYAEWIYENNKWEKFGVNSIDLNAYYTKTETNTLLGNKADKSTTYTKTETDALLDEKADATDVTTALTLKADTTDVTSALALKADKTETYTKTETDALLNSKQDTLTFDNVPTAGSNNPVKSSGIKSALDEKANSTDVYTKTESDALLDAKENTILKSTSGAIASFDDGVEAPAAHVVAKIEPVQAGSGDPSPDNVRPITGWTGVNVTRTGKNFVYFPPIDNSEYSGVAFSVSNGILNISGTASSTDPAYAYNSSRVTQYNNMQLGPYPAGTYTIKSTGFIGQNKNDRIVCSIRYADNTAILDSQRISGPVGSIPDGTGQALTFTATKPFKVGFWIAIVSGTSIDCKVKVMMNLGTEPESYEPYQGDTYSITFPSSVGTVYGGELDVTSGKLTVDRKMITINNIYSITSYERVPITIPDAKSIPETIVGKIKANYLKTTNKNELYMHDYSISALDYNSHGIFIRFDSTYTTIEQYNNYLAEHPLKVVYELATPFTYQLTPTEITILLGQNNIWADTGDITVDYFRNKELADAIDNTIVDYEKQVINKPDSMVTDNIELTSTATQNYTAGSLAIVQNQLIRITQNIATGGAITIGSNAETIDLETLIAEKAEKILVAKLPFLSSADLYNNTADFHNAMPRGKDITSYLTDGSLWDRINGANGYSLFEDLYVGDYLTAGGQDYMIVDFDYYIRCGDGMDITQHHLVMMPTGNMSIPEGTVLYGSVDTLTLINTANYREHTGDDTVTVTSQETATAKKWNATIDAPNTNTTAGGYKFSRMRQVIMKAADTIIVNAFGLTHIKPIPVLYPNPANAEASGLASNWTWYKDTDWTSDLRRSICDLPNETQIYGQQVWGKGSAWNTGGHEVGVDKWQFALFKNNRARANILAGWWLRSVSGAAGACRVSSAGYAASSGTSLAYGVRPRFLLFG